MINCKNDGCEKPVKAMGLCTTHYYSDKKARETRICAVEDCSNKHHCRGLCVAHYQRLQKHGTPDYMSERPERHCAVDGCERRYYAKGYCRSHYDKVNRYGQPEAPVVVKETTYCHCGREAGSRGLCKAHYGRVWREEHLGTYSADAFNDVPPSYETAHVRVALVRNRARNYACDLCGGPADEWALSADAENLLFSALGGRTTLSAYSADVYDYFPACSDCHRRYDAEHGNRNFSARPARWEEAS